MKSILLYTKNNCVRCKMTKKVLSTMKINFKEINISQHDKTRKMLVEKGYKQTPVVAINGKLSFSGFRPDLLKKLPTTKKF